MRNPSMTKGYDAVALTLHSWFKHKRKNWGIIKRSWLLKRVQQSQGVTMNIRTLDRALARMRHMDLLYSETRHRKDKTTGEFIPEVSILYFTDGLKSYVAKMCKYFKIALGFVYLTEYTVPDLSTRQSEATKPLVEPQPDKPNPKYTNWAALGGAVRA